MKIEFVLTDADVVRLISYCCNVKASAVREKLKLPAFRNRLSKHAKSFFANLVDDYNEMDAINEGFNRYFKKSDFLPDDEDLRQVQLRQAQSKPKKAKKAKRKKRKSRFLPVVI